jgi:hypothetical protein
MRHLNNPHNHTRVIHKASRSICEKSRANGNNESIEINVGYAIPKTAISNSEGDFQEECVKKPVSKPTVLVMSVNYS